MSKSSKVFLSFIWSSLINKFYLNTCLYSAILWHTFVHCSQKKQIVLFNLFIRCLLMYDHGVPSKQMNKTQRTTNRHLEQISISLSYHTPADILEPIAILLSLERQSTSCSLVHWTQQPQDWTSRRRVCHNIMQLTIKLSANRTK